MSFGPVDLLFNIVLMLFWFRVWNRDQRVFSRNPYISSLADFTQPVLDLFRSLPGSLAGGRAAFAAWVVLVLFRGFALPSLNPEGVRQAWILRLGFEGVSPAMSSSPGVYLFIFFSFLSFAVFLFQVWGFALLFLMGYGRFRPSENPPEFLAAAARPFSEAPSRFRPWLLLGYGILLAAMIHAAADGRAVLIPVSSRDVVLTGARYAVAATAGVVDLLLILRTLLIVLIIGSWIVILTGAHSLMMVCREWLDFLLGPFRKFPIRLGPLDLTPIIAFLALGIVHWLLNGNVLPRLYIMLLYLNLNS